MPNIPIFLSADNNYAPFVTTTIASICDNTKSFCDFYILDGGISEENQEKICSLKKQFDNFSIEFIKIDLEKEFCSIDYKNECSYVSLSTYNRFLIPKLKPNLDKILYLDVDIIALGDIADLYKESLENYIVGAVEDYEAEFRNRDFILPSHNYFNAGVLLIDCEKWRAHDITKKLFEIELKYRNQLKFADQDVLNKLFENNYKILEKRYNRIFPKKNDNIILRHYAGELKPYFFPNNFVTQFFPHIREFWFYAQKTMFYSEIQNLIKPMAYLNSEVRKKQVLSMFKKVKYAKN